MFAVPATPKPRAGRNLCIGFPIPPHTILRGRGTSSNERVDGGNWIGTIDVPLAWGGSMTAMRAVVLAGCAALMLLLLTGGTLVPRPPAECGS
jgi:hypothetical protein